MNWDNVVKNAEARINMMKNKEYFGMKKKNTFFSFTRNRWYTDISSYPTYNVSVVCKERMERYEFQFVKIAAKMYRIKFILNQKNDDDDENTKREEYD